jgi:hypothetical protein
MLANSADEQNDVALYGFKGILNLNEEELLKQMQFAFSVIHSRVKNCDFIS